MVSVFHHTRLGRVVFPLPQAMGMAVIEVIVSAVLLAVLCFFMMRIAEIAFGSPGPAALKILAIAIAPAAIAGTVSELIHDIWGLVGFSLAFGMVYVMYYYMFEMDQGEVFLLGGTSTVVTMLSIWFVAPMLLATLPGFQSLHQGGQSNDDRTVANLTEFGRKTDNSTNGRFRISRRERNATVRAAPGSHAYRFARHGYRAFSVATMLGVSGDNGESR